MRMRLSRPQSRIILDPARFKVIVAGRRFGKTKISVAKLGQASTNHYRITGRGTRGIYWYIAPTYSQAKMIAWDDFKDFLAPYTARVNEQSLTVKLRNGCSVSLKGAQNPDRLRGPGLDGLIIDEFADIPPKAWDEVLRPMLADKGGWAWFIGTPKGRNHFYDLYQKVGDRVSAGEDWSRFQFTTREGGWVPQDEIERALTEMDERSFRQEFEATFENFSGLVYYTFNRDKDVQKVDYDPRFPLRWSLDFNVDPMASVICQIIESESLLARKKKRLVVLDELALRNADTAEACEAFSRKAMRWYSGRPIELVVYGDASGKNRSRPGQARTGSSDWDIVRAFFQGKREFIVTYKVPSGNPLVKDRINSVNSLFCNWSGERFVTIHPQCVKLKHDLEHVPWATDKAGRTTGEIDKSSDSMVTHWTDALGYLVFQEFPVLPARTGFSSRYIT